VFFWEGGRISRLESIVLMSAGLSSLIDGESTIYHLATVSHFKYIWPLQSKDSSFQDISQTMSA
jgi:hypothetical protein